MRAIFTVLIAIFAALVLLPSTTAAQQVAQPAVEPSFKEHCAV